MACSGLQFLTSDSMSLLATFPRQNLTVNIHCEFSSRFHSDSKRIRSGFESKRRESPRIHNVFAQQYGFAKFGRVFTVIRCETLSWEFTVASAQIAESTGSKNSLLKFLSNSASKFCSEMDWWSPKRKYL